jgi:hypothetical protein
MIVLNVNICLLIYLSKTSKKKLFIATALQFCFRVFIYENQVGLKLNGKLQLVVYADNVDLLGDNVSTMDKNTEIFN